MLRTMMTCFWPDKLVSGPARGICARLAGRQARFGRRIRAAGAGLLVLLLAGCGQRHAPLGRFNQLREFQLVERSGRQIGNGDVTGRILAVECFFTSCSAQCLTLAQQMETLQRLTAGSRDVLLLSVSVDPRTDTPEVLQRYAAHHNADTNRWLFLTGDKKVVYTFIRQSLLLVATEDNGLAASLGGGFNHSTKIVLVDQRGLVRAYYDGMDPSAPRQILSGIEQLRKESHRGASLPPGPAPPVSPSP